MFVDTASGSESSVHTEYYHCHDIIGRVELYELLNYRMSNYQRSTIYQTKNDLLRPSGAKSVLSFNLRWPNKPSGDQTKQCWTRGNLMCPFILDTSPPILQFTKHPQFLWQSLSYRVCNVQKALEKLFIKTCRADIYLYSLISKQFVTNGIFNTISTVLYFLCKQQWNLNNFILKKKIQICRVDEYFGVVRFKRITYLQKYSS